MCDIIQGHLLYMNIKNSNLFCATSVKLLSSASVYGIQNNTYISTLQSNISQWNIEVNKNLHMMGVFNSKNAL